MGRQRGRSVTGRLVVLLVAAAVAIAACGADDPVEGVALLVDEKTMIIVANSPGTLSTNGEQRVLVALIGTGGPNDFVGSADEAAIVQFAAVDGEGEGEVPAEWLSNPGVALGLYVAPFTFAEAGRWEVSIKGADEVNAALVEVAADSVVPETGDPAPASITPTATSIEELSLVSTDPTPEPAFYDLTISDAVTNGRPTVIVFATPAFCRTAICGPTVEIAKDVADGRDGVDFVHVEPFVIEAAQAGTLTPIEAMFDWGLATEPWVFVVDGDGVITASFEGIIGQGELEQAVDAL